MHQRVGRLSYDEIRAALQKRESFYLHDLQHITRLGFDLVYSGEVTHPAIPYTIATITEKIASRWAGQALPDDTAASVEAHVRPILIALLDVTEADDAIVGRALNDAVRAYVEAIPMIDKVENAK